MREEYRDSAGCPKFWAAATLAIILFAGTLSIYKMNTPAPLPSNAPDVEFSAYRAIQHDYVMATEPHPAGSPANDRVQAYIRDTMRALGVETEIVSDYVARGHSAGQRNMVLGRIPGVANTKAFALMAHYDSVPYGPGAADDLGGVIAMIETARALKASPPLKNDIIFVFTDCEEGGKLGAYAFSDHAWFKEVGVMANLEARGTQGNSLLFGTSEENGWLIEQVIAGVRYPVASSLMYDIYKRMPFSSDFDELRPLGMKGFDIAFVDNFPWYHTKNDKPEHLHLGTLQQHGMYALDMARHFGGMPLDGPVTAPDAMYFNTLGYNMVIYPLSWGWNLALAIAGLAGAAMILGRLRKHITFSGMAAGAVIWALAALLSALAAVAMLAIIWGPDTVRRLYLEDFTRIPNLLPLHHTNLYVAAFGMAAIAVTSLVYGFFGRWIQSQSLLLGAYVWWTAALILVARYLPGGGYLIMWPLAFSVLGILICFLFAKGGPLSARWIAFLAVFSMPGIILLVPPYRVFGYTIMLMGAPGLAVYAVLTLGLMIPQLDLMARINRWWLPCLSGALAAIMLIIGLTHSSYTPLRPKLNSVSYGIDYDANQAFWLGADPEPDEWTIQFFPPGTPRLAYKEFGGHRDKVMKAPAPIAPEYPGPQLNILSDSTSGGVRELTIRMDSPAQPARLELRMVSETPVLGASVFGKPLDGAEKNWHLGFNLFPKGGTDLILRVPADSPVHLNVLETYYGLPSSLGFAPRPEYMAAFPNTVDHNGRRLDSNRIFVTRTVVL